MRKASLRVVVLTSEKSKNVSQTGCQVAGQSSTSTPIMGRVLFSPKGKHTPNPKNPLRAK
jgi:hypothetical protein